MSQPREALIAARKRRGLSRAELAKILGVHRSHVDHVETGVGNPSFDLMVSWKNALNVRGSEIWEGEYKRFEPRIKASFERARRVWDLP